MVILVVGSFLILNVEYNAAVLFGTKLLLNYYFILLLHLMPRLIYLQNCVVKIKSIEDNISYTALYDDYEHTLKK